MTITARDAARMLQDPDRRALVTARASLGEAVLASPGLYAVWVDDAGARCLSEGMAAAVEPGLVYVGQAGAISPGETRQIASTLGTRWKQHMGSDPWKSTLRRTLWAALGGQVGQPVTGERALTAWMGEHLAVSMVPVPDRRALDRLEDEVVEVLDPPFNLEPQSLPRTSVRVFLDTHRVTKSTWLAQSSPLT